MKKLFVNLLLRNFLKNKFLNTLNILGLSGGIIAALLVAFYVHHELSYDTFHKEGKSIYRMEAKTNNPNWTSNLGMEHSRELQNGNYPEVQDVLLVNTHNQTFLSAGNRRFVEKNIRQVATQAPFFEFFDFELLEGDRTSLLSNPYSAVMTKSVAEKYFGDQRAIGQSLEYDSLKLTVTGVLADLPTNSHMSFDILITNPQTFSGEHFHSQNYIKLVPGADPSQLEQKILGMEGVAQNEFHELSEVNLLPIEDIYFKSQSTFGFGGSGDRLQLTVFIIVGILILIIAVANYINLSLAIYSGKGMEVGMRKVLGESRAQVIRAFFFDSLATTLLTLPVVFIGLYFILPEFSQFMGLSIENQLLSSSEYWILLLLFLSLLSVSTIIYPATTLTGIKISTLLKSKSAVHSSGGIRLRNALIFIQFILLFTLGISAWFMNQQISYLDNKDMGFEADGIIKITNAFEVQSMNDFKLLKTELMKSPLVAGVTFGPMMGDFMVPLAYKPEGQDEIYENLLSYGVDIDYFDVMGMDILNGEFKNTLLAADPGQVISLVNESFVKRFGWQNDPIGKKLILRPGTENELHRKVSAVFNDFHFFTLKEKISPQIISLRNDPQFVNTNILVKASGTNLQQVIEEVEEGWATLLPEVPMQYDFMDDAVKRYYINEKRTGQISVLFSTLAVLLSLLGLIGFMAYVIGLRSKEIAVRKVLGATLIQIVSLLNKQLFIIILIAATTGSALSYWLISTWLADYAYAIKLQPQTFVLAAIIVYGIVFVITGLQSFKSALFNPVVALKND